MSEWLGRLAFDEEQIKAMASCRGFARARLSIEPPGVWLSAQRDGREGQFTKGCRASMLISCIDGTTGVQYPLPAARCPLLTAARKICLVLVGLFVNMIPDAGTPHLFRGTVHPDKRDRGIILGARESALAGTDVVVLDRRTFDFRRLIDL